MSTQRVIMTAAAGLLLAALPVIAHHSMRAEYDETRLITLSGTVAKVSWKNPHVMLSLEAKTNSGETANWEIELASPNGLLMQGWKVDSLKPGDRVTVSGYAAKSGSRVLNAKKIVLGTTALSTARDDTR